MRDWRYAVVLVGIAATWLPWMAYPERTIFQFYTIAIWPFLLLALTFALQHVAGAASTVVSGARRDSGSSSFSGGSRPALDLLVPALVGDAGAV
jgi:dolichyl-phosphate-mannose--protein O-mannosyl transferase